MIAITLIVFLEVKTEFVCSVLFRSTWSLKQLQHSEITTVSPLA
jgi:hypothetical protein